MESDTLQCYSIRGGHNCYDVVLLVELELVLALSLKGDVISCLLDVLGYSLSNSIHGLDELRVHRILVCMYIMYSIKLLHDITATQHTHLTDANRLPMTVMAALAPLSSSLILLATSRALIFSTRLASRPFHT